MELFKRSGLYLVTSYELSDYPSLFIIEECLKAGCKLFQLREKSLSKEAYFKQAVEAKKLSQKYSALFIVNDHVDIAKAVGADGVHLGQEDIKVAEARKILGEDFIIGVSTHNVKEVLEAENNGADYINIGPIFNTNTKPHAEVLGIEGVKKILPYVKVPYTFMGGIKIEHVKKLKELKPSAIAVITYITKNKFPVDISAFLS